jgi:hypothetical protein
MKFEITQFTFDPRNHVFVTDFVLKQLQKTISEVIFRKLKTDKLYAGWSLVYVVSSDDDYAKRLHINRIPTKSPKYKTIEYYVYFPRMTSFQNDSEKPKAYNLNKFIGYFVDGLQVILEGWELDKKIYIECKRKAKERIADDPRSIYNVEDEITISEKEIRQILKEAKKNGATHS